jgi:hypothetical protein
MACGYCRCVIEESPAAAQAVKEICLRIRCEQWRCAQHTAAAPLVHSLFHKLRRTQRAVPIRESEDSIRGRLAREIHIKKATAPWRKIHGAEYCDENLAGTA